MNTLSQLTTIETQEIMINTTVRDLTRRNIIESLLFMRRWIKQKINNKGIIIISITSIALGIIPNVSENSRLVSSTPIKKTTVLFI